MDTDPVAIAVAAAFGVLYGLVLQRSGFCFARAALELFLLRSRDAMDGILAGLIVATVGFAAVTAVRSSVGADPATGRLILPVGPGTFLGAAIFGLGMSLAGMCVVGSLLRLGEGYAAGALTLAGMVAGAAIDPFRLLLGRSLLLPPTSLPDWLGRLISVALTLAVLAALWRLAARREEAGATRSRALAPAVIGGVLLAVLNTAQMAWRSPWTVAYPLGVVASAASGQLGPAVVRGALPLLALDLGVVLGAAASALAARDLRFRWPRQRRQLALSVAGGVLMGWGVQLAHGCNIGGLFSALPSLSLSAWLFLPGLLLGSWAGSRLLRRIG
ncbi:MAG: YeeE/YedE thiosulfate transporter family protein [Armatimonadota bacterium]